MVLVKIEFKKTFLNRLIIFVLNLENWLLFEENNATQLLAYNFVCNRSCSVFKKVFNFLYTLILNY